MTARVTAEEIAALKDIIMKDPIAGPLCAERNRLREEMAPFLRQISPIQMQISDLTNRINNVGSITARSAILSLSKMRINF